ncbi:MAG TPA: TonB-dependent receptor [Bacteroidales bacterium]|nr:TonB-dependent receptor [Bacteroidales bacterium]
MGKINSTLFWRKGALFLFIVFCLTGREKILGQYNEYSFNTPGNVCYLKYITLTPDTSDKSIKRPFIFILGKENESALDVMKGDTLKTSRNFFNYEFIYLPNPGENARKKLQCIPSISSLVTDDYRYGKVNLFLKVNDDSITGDDIKEYRLNAIFRKVRLKSEDRALVAAAETKTSLLDDFKEKFVQYEPIKKEETAIFYTEPDSLDNSGDEGGDIKPVKTYTGPPVKSKFTITGVVKDKITGERLPFATVTILGTTLGTTTNNDGYFTLLKVPTDTSTIVVQYVGYEKWNVFLTPSSPLTNMIIELKAYSQRLQGVTVTAHRNEVAMANKENISLIKITPKKLEELPGLGERDIMRSFQLMPGISASNESSSGLYVRGGTPDQNLIIYDGFTVYHVDHLYGFFSAFNSNALKDVQLYKGGFESKFGGRLSSVTEITGKDGNQKRFNVGGDISLLSANVYVEAPVGDKITTMFAFRRSYQGPIYDAIFKKFNSSADTRVLAPSGSGAFRRPLESNSLTSYFYDLNGKITYHPTDKDIVTLSIFNGTDKLDNGISNSFGSFGTFNRDFSMQNTDLTKYGNIGGSFRWSRKWSDKLYGNTVLSYSKYYSTRDRSSQRVTVNSSNETVTTNQGIFENNHLRDYSLKSDYRYDLTSSNQIQFGVFATWYDIKYTYAQNDTSTLIDRHDNGLLTGLYLQDDIKLLKDRMHIVPGIRSNFYGVTGRFYAEPRASVTYSLSEKVTLKGSTGKYYQFANRVTREDILSGSRDFWVLSDGSQIPVSSAVHFIAGISYENNDYIFSAEGYYKSLKDITENSLRINSSPAGVSYNQSFFSGYGYSQGIEFLAQRKSGNLNGWICYTIGQARNHFTEYSDTYYPADQDVTHEIKVVTMYKWKRFDFSANFIYATGRPYTAPSGAYSIKLLDGSSRDFFTVTSKNSLRLPDYNRLDVSATYKLLAGWRGEKRRREIGYIGISIFNLYNHKNVWYKQYAIQDGSIIETNINYLGITPNITLSLKLR